MVQDQSRQGIEWKEGAANGMACFKRRLGDFSIRNLLSGVVGVHTNSIGQGSKSGFDLLANGTSRDILGNDDIMLVTDYCAIGTSHLPNINFPYLDP